MSVEELSTEELRTYLRSLTKARFADDERMKLQHIHVAAFCIGFRKPEINPPSTDDKKIQAYELGVEMLKYKKDE